MEVILKNLSFQNSLKQIQQMVFKDNENLLPNNTKIKE